MLIRPATESDCSPVSEMCMRSKAHWGYDKAFMQACREELSLSPQDLITSDVVVAMQDDNLLGYAKVEYHGKLPELGGLFIDPGAMGLGVGKALFLWAAAQCKNRGASTMTIVSDPFAASFYEKMGSRKVGMVPSGSIVGRKLPAYEYALKV